MPPDAASAYASAAASAAASASAAAASAASAAAASSPLFTTRENGLDGPPSTGVPAREDGREPLCSSAVRRAFSAAAFRARLMREFLRGGRPVSLPSALTVLEADCRPASTSPPPSTSLSPSSSSSSSSPSTTDGRSWSPSDCIVCRTFNDDVSSWLALLAASIAAYSDAACAPVSQCTCRGRGAG